jgi:hypothetical protein
MPPALWQLCVLWQRRSTLAGALALLSGIPHLTRGQSRRLAPSTFVWGSASNSAVSFTFGSAKHGALVVLGLAGSLETGKRTAMVGAGVRFNAVTTSASILGEGLVGSGGWAGRLALVTRSDRGQASVLGRVFLTHAVGPGGDPPEVEGTVALHGRLSPALRWGTAYDFDLKTHKAGEHRLGPSLEVRLPRAALRLDFGHGMGRAADAWTVTVFLVG